MERRAIGGTQSEWRAHTQSHTARHDDGPKENVRTGATHAWGAFDASFVHRVAERPSIATPDEFQSGVRRRCKMAGRHALAHAGYCLVPLQRQLALLRRIVDCIMLIVELLLDLRLLQPIHTDVRIQVRLNVFCHRLGLPHQKVVKQIEKVKHGAISPRDIEGDPPLDEADAVWICGIGQREPDASLGHLVQRLREVFSIFACFCQELVEAPTCTHTRLVATATTHDTQRLA